MAQTYTHLQITVERRPWVNKAIPIVGRSLAFASALLPESWISRLGAMACKLLVRFGCDIQVKPCS